MILLFSNPRSGRNQRDPGLGSRLARLLPPSGLLLQPEGPEATVRALAGLRRDDVELVAVNGGDGTLAHVLTALCRAWDEELPPIAILRGGTMNTVAHGIGLRGSPEQILARRLRPGPQPVVTRHLMRIQDGAGLPRYGFLFGNGVISNFLEVYYQYPRPGPRIGAWVLIRAMLSALVGGAFARRLTRPTEIEVELDGQVWPLRRFMAVAAGTVDDLGLGFRAFGRVVAAPGRLQALGFGCSAAALALRIPGTLWARPWRHPAIIDQLGARLVLRGEEPIAYMVEGDFFRGGREVSVEVGPAVRLACP